MTAPEISPKYIIDLIEKVKNGIWDAMPAKTYKNVENYLTKWQNASYDYYGNLQDINFEIFMTERHIVRLGL